MQGLLQEYIDVAGDGYRGGMQSTGEEEMGKSVALELVKTSPGNGKYGESSISHVLLFLSFSRGVLIGTLRHLTAALPAWGNWNADASSSFARTFAAKSFFGGEAQRNSSSSLSALLFSFLTLSLCSRQRYRNSCQARRPRFEHRPPQAPLQAPRTSRPLLPWGCDRHQVSRGASPSYLPLKSSTHPRLQPDFTILHHVVTLPIRLFTEASIAVGQEVWTWLADARPEVEPRVVAEVLEAWAGTVEKEQGLFSTALECVSLLSSTLISFSTFVGCRTDRIRRSRSPENPLDQKTEYTPTDKSDLTRDFLLANRVFSPMLELLDFLSSRFQAFRYRNGELVEASMRLVVRSLEASERWRCVSSFMRFFVPFWGFSRPVESWLLTMDVVQHPPSRP